VANNKYIHAKRLIYETVRKMVELKIEPETIACDLFKTHRLEVELHDIPKSMVLKMYQVLAEQCWYDTYKEHYIGE